MDMLVLSRIIGQTIVINGDIHITFLGYNSHHPEQLKIGIEAPRSIIVDREEVHYKRLAGLSTKSVENSGDNNDCNDFGPSTHYTITDR